MNVRRANQQHAFQVAADAPERCRHCGCARKMGGSIDGTRSLYATAGSKEYGLVNPPCVPRRVGGQKFNAALVFRR